MKTNSEAFRVLLKVKPQTFNSGICLPALHAFEEKISCILYMTNHQVQKKRKKERKDKRNPKII